jgi:proteasome lid subunit RPN8/RPN11
MNALSLPQSLLDQIRAHGEAHYPDEGAGLLLGRLGGEQRLVTRLVPLDNDFDERERHHRYLISPRAMLDAQTLADSLELDILGVFHSHPDHPAEPSEFDRQWALPWFSYLITRVQEGQARESRTWRLSEDRRRFEEQPLDIESQNQPSQEAP